MINKKLYIENYGCAMNFSDSELVASIMKKEGYNVTEKIEYASAIFLNTCSIREKAENRVIQRLKELESYKKIDSNVIVGVLGCMAERMKTKLLDITIADIVVGPDAYKKLPSLVSNFYKDGLKGANVILSKTETYDQYIPLRYSSNGVSAFITITRGCDNMCSFCVVPYTRGRERSRDNKSIINEAINLKEKGYKEITLLGQNVDSYLWYGGGPKKDFSKANDETKKRAVTFSDLLEQIALAVPEIRIRFSTSNPQDMSDRVFELIKKYDNICKYVHLPIQSGSDKILKKMNRGHKKDWYLEKIKKLKELVPDCSISTDLITGFCGETEQDHKETLDLMNIVKFDYSYMFKYSERPNTFAQRNYKNDVSEEIKSRRLSEIIKLQSKLSKNSNIKDLNKTFEVLVEGVSKKSSGHLYGRNSQNKVVVFPKKNANKGEIVKVFIENCTSATLKGKII